MSERVILAYSGGLDTSVAISWIGKETGREVVAVAIDLGQGGEDMEVRTWNASEISKIFGKNFKSEQIKSAVISPHSDTMWTVR